MRKPKVLLLDEPFGALDPGIRADIHVLMKRIWNDTDLTVVMVTHDLREAFELGTRVIAFERPRDRPEERERFGATAQHRTSRFGRRRSPAAPRSGRATAHRNGRPDRCRSPTEDDLRAVIRSRDDPDLARSATGAGVGRANMTTLIASDTLPGGKHWSMMLWRNSRLKLTDVEGGANAGMLFYNPLNLLERYNAPDTLEMPAQFQAHARTLPLLGHGPHLLLHRVRHVRLARHGLRQHHQGCGSAADGARQLPDETATTGSRTATTASWSKPRNTASAGAILPPTSTGSARSWWRMTAR